MKENSKRGSTSLALKAGFWYVVSTFLLKSIAFITTPIFSRLMTTTDYGEFSNYASWQSTLLIITGAELYSTLSRAYYDYKDEFDKYVSSVTVLNCLLTLSFYIMFVLGKGWIFEFVAIPSQYIHILFMTLLCTSCKTIFLTRERTLYKYKSVAMLSVVDTMIPTIISVILVCMVDVSERLSARIYGFYFPSAMIGLVCSVLIIYKGRSFKISHCRYAFKLCLPLLVHYLTIYLLTSTNTIITKGILGAESTAFISMATSVVHILTVLFQAASGAVTTWLMDNLDVKNYIKIKKETVIYVAVLAIISIGVILFAPEIIWILGGNKYKEAVFLIPGLVVAVFIQSITTIFTLILTYDKNVSKTAVYTGIVAVLSIFAKVLLLPIMGMHILAIINIFAYGILFAVNYILVKKAGYEDTINLKRIIFCIVLVCTVMIFSLFSYENMFIHFGGIILAAVIVGVFIYRNKILFISIIKKRK